MFKVIFIFIGISILSYHSISINDTKKREIKLTEQHISVLKMKLKIMEAQREENRINTNNKNKKTIWHLNDKGEWIEVFNK